MSINKTETLKGLKAQAEGLGITFSPNIGIESLQAKIIEHFMNAEKFSNPVESTTEIKNEDKHYDLYRKASKLLRVVVRPVDTDKSVLAGEIFKVGNSVMPAIAKFVPYGLASGYHIPQMIYDALLEKKVVVVNESKQLKVGESVEEVTDLVPAYNIEILPPLTREELERLARDQAMTSRVAVHV